MSLTLALDGVSGEPHVTVTLYPQEKESVPIV